MKLCKFCHDFHVIPPQKDYCSILCYRAAKAIRERLRVTPPKPEARIRPCMRCGQDFESEHKFHRICDKCSNAIERMAPVAGRWM